MKANRRFTIAALAIGILLGSWHRATAQPSPASCSAAEEKLWQRSQDTLGIFVIDNARRIGGGASIVKFDDKGLKSLLNPLLAGYHPASGYKELACGTLDRWSLYVLGKNERDLHPHIKLSPGFLHLLHDQPLGGKVDDCEGCIFGEVTVPDEFEWFWKDGAQGTLSKGSNKCGDPSEPCANKTTVLTSGAKFCAYGPWIMEKAHGFWPEIHPLQAFWGQASEYASLYVVDDNSQRFQQKDNFALDYLSPVGALPWGSHFDATVYQVVRIDPARGGSLTWRDDKKQSLPKAAINTGAGQITLSAPSWIDAELAAVCRTRTNQTQAILQAKLRFDDHQRWRALDIAGSGTGISYGRGKVGPSQAAAPRPAEVEARWSASTKIGWEDNRQLSILTSSNLGASSAEWGVSARDTEWLGVARQQLDVRPEVFEGDRSALLKSLRSEWTVSIVDLNNRAVTPTTGFRVQLRHPRGIPLVVKGPVEQIATNDSSFKLTAIFDAPEVPPQSGQYRFENLKATVKVRLSAPDTAFEYQLDLYSIVPDFIAQVAGYDLKTQKGVFPPKLSQVIAPWLVARGCRTVTLDSWNAELEGKAKPDFTPAPLWALLNRRMRDAGIVRQTVNLALADRTLDAREFVRVMDALGRYREACLADPPLQ